MKNRIFIFLVVLIFLSVFYYIFCPIIFFYSRTTEYSDDNENLTKGQVVYPLKNLNVTSVYVVFEDEDVLKLPDGMNNANVIFTKNKLLINKLCDNFSFKYMNVDVATCQSYICCFNKNRLVFKSNILLEKGKFGLQNSYYGFIESENEMEIIELLKRFRKYFSPILIF